jgi:Leucine-rich repeat (LRR) protein
MDTINTRLGPDVVEALKALKHHFSEKIEALENELECLSGRSNMIESNPVEPSPTHLNVLSKFELLDKQIHSFMGDLEKMKINQKQNENRFDAMIEIFNRCLHRTQVGNF